MNALTCPLVWCARLGHIWSSWLCICNEYDACSPIHFNVCFLEERNNLKFEFKNLKMGWQFARLAAILSVCGLVVSPLSYRSQSCSPLFYLKITSKLIIQLLRAFLGGKSCRWIAGCKRSWDILCRPLMKQWLGIIWPCNMENSKLLIARTYALNILQIGFSAYRASRP